MNLERTHIIQLSTKLTLKIKRELSLRISVIVFLSIVWNILSKKEEEKKLKFSSVQLYDQLDQY